MRRRRYSPEKLIRLLLASPNTGNRSRMSNEDFLRFASEYPPVLDAEMKYVFFSHAKVAQTSINRHLLSRRSIVRKDSHFVHATAMKKLSRNWDVGQPVVFTIVRNPYTRVRSGFAQMQKAGDMDLGRNLNDFILKDLRAKGPYMDRRLIPQEKFSKPLSEMGFDRIIRIENLQSEWAELSRLIGAPSTLPQENKARYRAEGHELSDEAKAVIGELYETDFTRLGYERLF